jgi:hypothetical protein
VCVAGVSGDAPLRIWPIRVSPRVRRQAVVAFIVAAIVAFAIIVLVDNTAVAFALVALAAGLTTFIVGRAARRT